MRNRLTHVYFDINVDGVWQTTQEDLAPVVEALERLIRQEEP